MAFLWPKGLWQNWAAPSHNFGVPFDELSFFVQQYALPNPSFASCYSITLSQNKTDASSKAIDEIHIPDYSKYVPFTSADEEIPPVPSPVYLSIHVTYPKVPHLSGGSKYIKTVPRQKTIQSSTQALLLRRRWEYSLFESLKSGCVALNNNCVVFVHVSLSFALILAILISHIAQSRMETLLACSKPINSSRIRSNCITLDKSSTSDHRPRVIYCMMGDLCTPTLQLYQLAWTGSYCYFLRSFVRSWAYWPQRREHWSPSNWGGDVRVPSLISTRSSTKVCTTLSEHYVRWWYVKCALTIST